MLRLPTAAPTQSSFEEGNQSGICWRGKLIEIDAATCRPSLVCGAPCWQIRGELKKQADQLFGERDWTVCAHQVEADFLAAGFWSRFPHRPRARWQSLRVDLHCSSGLETCLREVWRQVCRRGSSTPFGVGLLLRVWFVLPVKPSYLPPHDKHPLRTQHNVPALAQAEA